MGREIRRKQAKTQGKPLTVEKQTLNNNPYNDVYKLLKTFGILLGIIILIYFFVGIVITKEIDWFSNDKKQQEVVNKAPNTILAKNTFNQKEEEYYVYYSNFDKEEPEILTLINSKLSNSKLYKVNTNDAFNSNFVTKEDTGNTDATNIDSLKVINPTLIKVVSGEIVEYYETLDNIKEYLK